MVLYYLLRSMRPRQWSKNLVVFAAITFAGQLFVPEKFLLVLATFVIFNLMASGVYLINDIIDFKRDQVHYFKKNRPIAKGLLSSDLAMKVALLLISGALLGGSLINNYLFLMLGVFLSVQIFYTYYLKHIALLDILSIATTFMIRIFAGFLVVANVEPITTLSSWLILTTIMVSLFLAIAKRRLELAQMSHKVAAEHRDTLTNYPTVLLDGMTFMMATATILTYSLFTFNEPERNRTFVASILPQALSTPKLLMVTIPLVIYGIFRYLYLIYAKKEGESPERTLLEDLPILTTSLLWVSSILGIVYILNR